MAALIDGTSHTILLCETNDDNTNSTASSSSAYGTSLWIDGHNAGGRSAGIPIAYGASNITKSSYPFYATRQLRQQLWRCIGRGHCQ